MYLSSLFLTNFRNYPELKISFEKNGALLTGQNGAGKTNLLESIFFVSTGRSQRNASKKQMISSECRESYVEGDFVTEKGENCRVAIGFSKDGRKKIKINDSEETSLSEWYSLSNVISFGPEDINLIYGPPVLRRRYLDMLLSTVNPEYLKALKNYKKALLNRNRLLTMNYNKIEIKLYEDQMAGPGSYIMQKRRIFLSEYDELFRSIVKDICSIDGSYRYIPSFKIDGTDSKIISDEIMQILESGRDRDRELGFTSRGPHRDDLYLYINDKNAKTFGSQGQCRSLSVSLRLLSLNLIKTVKESDLIILIDDAFAQLDNERRDNILSFFRESDQLFITSTGDVIDRTEKLEHLYISGGKINR